jgi:hypothetical protein
MELLMRRTAEQLQFERRLRECERLVRKLPEIQEPVQVNLSTETASAKLQDAGMLLGQDGSVKFTLRLPKIGEEEDPALLGPPH